MKLNSKKNLIVAPEADGLRLDIFISSQLGITRSRAQKLIEQRLALVNGKLPKKMGEKVKEGDRIEMSLTSPQPSPSKGEEANKSPLEGGRGVLAKPKIIAETSDYVVIEKPTGMLTHPTMAGEKNTLVNFLIKKYPEIKKVGNDPTIRPGVVHRLDKEASGLLVAARTQKMFNHLKEQFKNRTIGKEYYALVHGKVAKDWDIITFPIARGKTHERMAARPLRRDLSPALSSAEERETAPLLLRKGGDKRGGLEAAGEEIAKEKSAKTEFLIERRFVNFTLLRVTLHTGRMHQIRVHLLAYNHPLVGDPLYFQKKRKRLWDERLGRLFLHATKLSFTDLEGQRQTFESLLPEELEEFLKLLK